MTERLPDHLPAALLARPEFIAACQARDLGAIFRLARKWAGFTHSHLARRCEMSPSRVGQYVSGHMQAHSLELFERTSEGLRIPGSMLGLVRQPWEGDHAVEHTIHVQLKAAPDRTATTGDLDTGDFDEMNRRELLRALAILSPLVALPPSLDESMRQVPRAADPVGLEEHKAMNGYLWRVYAMSTSKRAVYPVVRQQLGALKAKLEKPHTPAAHTALCTLISDLLQLAGEISFDGNYYTEAAHCYALAASAGKEAKDYDLWACALSRHAFIGMHERRLPQTASMLTAAAQVAGRGDKQLSTRQWVAVLQAQTHAGMGDYDACNKALDVAATVHCLSGEVHNGGWLRFDGSRLAEEAGSCYVQLGRHDLAHSALADAMSRSRSPRRQGSVLTDLALLGVQQRDVDQVVQYGSAALELVQQTDSGYVGRKLKGLQAGLTPLLSDRRVLELSGHITAVAQPA